MPYTHIPFQVRRSGLEARGLAKGSTDPGSRFFSLATDISGAIMRFTDHGETNSKFEWEIDHIKPTSLSGADDLANLQPLHWENNRKKADSYPSFCG